MPLVRFTVKWQNGGIEGNFGTNKCPKREFGQPIRKEVDCDDGENRLVAQYSMSDGIAQYSISYDIAQYTIMKVMVLHNTV